MACSIQLGRAGFLFISFWAGRATWMRLRGNEYDTEKEMGKSSWYPYQSG